MESDMQDESSQETDLLTQQLLNQQKELENLRQQIAKVSSINDTVPGFQVLLNFAARHTQMIPTFRRLCEDPGKPSYQIQKELFALEQGFYKQILEKFPQYKEQIENRCAGNFLRIANHNEKKRIVNKQKRSQTQVKKTKKELEAIRKKEKEEEEERKRKEQEEGERKRKKIEQKEQSDSESSSSSSSSEDDLHTPPLHQPEL